MSYLIFFWNLSLRIIRPIEKRISKMKGAQKVNAVFLQNDGLPSTLIKPSISTYIRS
jgi:hypothetical protein